MQAKEVYLDDKDYDDDNIYNNNDNNTNNNNNKNYYNNGNAVTSIEEIIISLNYIVWVSVVTNQD